MSRKTDPGAKHDQGKAPLHSVMRYFPRALEQVARVNEHGAGLHGWDTWHTIADGRARYRDALVRHIMADAEGEREDADSGLLHVAHVAWNALAVLELELWGPAHQGIPDDEDLCPDGNILDGDEPPPGHRRGWGPRTL